MRAKKLEELKSLFTRAKVYQKPMLKIINQKQYNLFL